MTVEQFKRAPGGQIEVNLDRSEQDFERMVDSLDEETRATKGFRSIQDEVDESGDYMAGLNALTLFLEKRNRSLDDAVVSWKNPEVRVNKEDLLQLMAELRHSVNIPDGFLGNGSVAEVYNFGGENSNLCIKWITSADRYSEGVTVSKELSFLDALRDLEVGGVRAPKPLFAFQTIRMTGYVMEKLHATNFQRVIEEQTTEGIPDVLPANFDVDRYFGLLRQYVIEMHKLGIYHGDLHLRNVMIDRENGTPYIIDFGKSQFENELDKSGRYQKDLAENDFEAIRLAKIQVVNWLKNQQGKAE